MLYSCSRCMATVGVKGLIPVLLSLAMVDSLALRMMSWRTNFESLTMRVKSQLILQHPRATQTMTWMKVRLHATVSLIDLIALSLWHCLIKRLLHELVPPNWVTFQPTVLLTVALMLQCCVQWYVTVVSSSTSLVASVCCRRLSVRNVLWLNSAS